MKDYYLSDVKGLVPLTEGREKRNKERKERNKQLPKISFGNSHFLEQ